SSLPDIEEFSGRSRQRPPRSSIAAAKDMRVRVLADLGGLIQHIDLPLSESSVWRWRIFSARAKTRSMRALSTARISMMCGVAFAAAFHGAAIVFITQYSLLRSATRGRIARRFKFR